MSGAARLGDKAQISLDAHGCPACPHPGIGPAIAGSPDVNVNRRPAIRLDDPGIHMACCGTNQWKAMQGSLTVFVNGKPAVRMGDQTRHCGGIGKMIEGSPNVIIGGPPGMGSAGSGAGGGTAQTGSGTAPAPTAPSPASAAPAASAGSASASATSAAPPASAPPAAHETPIEPSPLLVSATWSVDRAPLATAVTLTAICEGMAGKPASFMITDADDATMVIASVSGTCGPATVTAAWRTPSSAPPTRLAFEVSADGKRTSSNVLTLVQPIEVTLVLDDEPAADVGVRLRVAPDGQQLSARADERGVVRFAEAPIGDYTLLLEDA